MLQQPGSQMRGGFSSSISKAQQSEEQKRRTAKLQNRKENITSGTGRHLGWENETKSEKAID